MFVFVYVFEVEQQQTHLRNIYGSASDFNLIHWAQLLFSTNVQLFICILCCPVELLVRYNILDSEPVSASRNILYDKAVKRKVK